MNPLLLLTTRPWSRKPGRDLRRVRVPVPTDLPTTDAIFLVLRRMRGPLILLLSVFAVSVVGLSLIPGVDADGRPYRLTIFESFYVMSYTATTIGFGEIPYAFTSAQRMWMTLSIYLTVTGWAYSLGSVFALVQDPALRAAVAMQRFRRRVRGVGQPFHIIAGFGNAGRTVARSLEEAGRRFVVVDKDKAAVDRLAAEQFRLDVPGIEADARNPAVLGLAGLDRPECAGVLAVTDDDHVNLAVVMAVQLLRPEVPVIARVSDRGVEDRMHNFAAEAVINPQDRYGAYLLLALKRPVTSQLVTWLMSPPGTELPPPRTGLADGRWLVCADGQFGAEVAHDLCAAGLDVSVRDPHDGDPDTRGFVGMLAGADDDAVNLAIAAHARHENPKLFLAVRQGAHTNAPLVQAFDFDSVYVPTELVAKESLAHIVAPVFWRFIDRVLHEDDATSQTLLERITERCGTRTPEADRIEIDTTSAPAVVRWLGGTGRAARGSLTLDDLLRDPADRDVPLRAIPIALVRDGETTHLPPGDTELAVGDHLLLLARSSALRSLSRTLFYDATVEYVATGTEVPQTWLFRALHNRRQARLARRRERRRAA